MFNPKALKTNQPAGCSSAFKLPISEQKFLKIAQRISSKRSPKSKIRIIGKKNIPKYYFTIGKRKVCDIIPIPKKHARKKFFQA
jgi:hypothetical protein